MIRKKMVLFITFLVVALFSTSAFSQGYEAEMTIQGIDGSVAVKSIRYRLASIPDVNTLMTLDVLPDGRVYSGEESQGLSFSLMKEVDRCSPALLNYFKDKSKISNVLVTIKKPKGKKIASFSMHDATILRHNVNKKSEFLTLNFEKIEFKTFK